MAAGLEKARELLEVNRRLYPAMERVLVLLTDGEANVPLVKGADVDSELALEARSLESAADRFVVIHTGEQCIDRMRAVVARARGEYYHVDRIAGSDVTDIIGG
jgi:Mg-chelatase subunit ChlD